MPRAAAPFTATALLAALAVALPAPAPAQSDPAALQMIEQLRPRTRGIRLPAPAAAESGGVASDAAAAPASPAAAPPPAAAYVPPATTRPPSPSTVATPTTPTFATPSTPTFATPTTPTFATPTTPAYVPPATAMAPARPVPAPAISAVTTAPAGVAAVSLTVNFTSGSAALTPQAETLLTSLGRALASPDLAPYRFRIEGHTDTVGDAWTNQHLSERRAAAVMNYLINKHGVAPSRLEAVGLGETSLLVPTHDGTNEPRNRRVQVINLDG
jgi:outer membrane protein OmpA-like peptidoglycan-associated protein